MAVLLPSKTADTAMGVDRRRYRRISMPLAVRYRMSDGTEGEGQVINISPAGALISAPDNAAYGDKVLVYIAKLGRFTTKVTRIERDGFAVHFDERPARIKRVADTLVWLLNGGAENNNRRKAKRIRQDRPAGVVIDGASYEATVLDISTTGASLAIKPKPKIGTQLTIGRTNAVVIRHHKDGVGVRFETTLPAKKQND